MSLRIGDLVITPNIMLLPVAFAFFLVLSFQQLSAGAACTRRDAWLALCCATCGGILGACVSGNLAVAGAHSWFNMRFGSLGGYWGVILGMVAYAAVTGQSMWRYGGALVPGLCIGGVIARIGCLFGGCCGGTLPFVPWPAYDIAALLATLAIVRRTKSGDAPSGMDLCVWLLAYGTLRFAIEFSRDVPAAVWFFTSSQVMCIIQVAAVACVWYWRDAP